MLHREIRKERHDIEQSQNVNDDDDDNNNVRDGLLVSH